MKRQMALGVALAMILASTTVDAQFGGLIRKKAGEVLGKKPEPAKPAPTAAPAPAPETSPAATAPATAAPATPLPPPASTTATPAAKKEAVAPLDASALPMRQSANQVFRDGGEPRANGDWNQLPYIPAAATTAAYALGDSARVALVETVGAGLKALVTSAAFMAEHAEYIKSQHQAVDHGLKAIVGIETALKKNDLKLFEAIQTRETIAMGVDQVRTIPPDFLQQAFKQELAKWKEYAANPKLGGRAKYQKLVAKAEPLEALAASDEKFLRGYAVLKSIDSDGPDTEEAVFAIHQRVKDEREQVAYDTHNLKGQLKQQLATFVTIAAKVNFDAPTTQKNGQTVFVNAADEKQGALWKACFRAGAAPTAAAVKLARAWLLEL